MKNEAGWLPAIAILAALAGCAAQDEPDPTPIGPPRLTVLDDVPCARFEHLGLVQPSPRPAGDSPELVWAHPIDPFRHPLSALPPAELPDGDLVFYTTEGPFLLVSADGSADGELYHAPVEQRLMAPVHGGDRWLLRPMRNIRWGALLRDVPFEGRAYTDAYSEESVGDWPGCCPEAEHDRHAAVSAAGVVVTPVGAESVLAYCVEDGRAIWRLDFDPRLAGTGRGPLFQKRTFVDAEGRFWFTNGSSKVFRFDASGVVDREFGSEDGMRRAALGYVAGCGLFVEVYADRPDELGYELWTEEGVRRGSWPIRSQLPDAALGLPDCSLLRGEGMSVETGEESFAALDARGEELWRVVLPLGTSSAEMLWFPLEEGGFLRAEISARVGSGVLRLERLSAIGATLWSVDFDSATLGGSPGLTAIELGRDGMIYGGTSASVFAIATGLHRAHYAGRRGTIYGAAAGPSHNASYESVWRSVGPAEPDAP
jgi:hypothetical protein